ncbi:hypothetical protein KBD81_02760 [Candidatus Woesebacteria bacterium]|jgi:Tfp pilus assembly protein PilN|nr:hypothetical protein [Candidatus Woesebacteria bacterium]
MINLLPYNQKKLVDRLRIFRVVMTVVMACALFIVVGIGLFVPTLVTINTRYAIATSQVEQFRASGAVVNPLAVSDLETRTTVLVDKFATPVSDAPVDYVTRVRSAAIAGVQLTGFVMQQGGIPMMQVTGTATSREQVQRFVETLRETAGVTTVESPLSNLIKSRDADFVVTVTFTK